MTSIRHRVYTEWRGLKVNTVGKVAGTLRGREEIEDSGMIAFRASGFFLT